MKFPGCYRISPVWDRINQPGYDKTNPEKLGSLELLLTLPYPIGELDPSIVCKPNYPGKRPRTVWGCGRIMYVFFADCDSPHLCVGLLFLILYPGSSSSASSSSAASSLSHTIFHTQLCHTQHLFLHTSLSTTILHTPSFHTQLCHTPSFTHNFVTPSFTHTTLSHTTSFFYTHLCQPPSCTHHLFTHNFVTHHLSHTTLSHTISFTHTIFHTLFHAPSFTHNFVTHHLYTQLCHTPSFHTQLCHTPSFTHNFVTHHIFHTQLCHKPSFTHSFTHHLSHTTLSHTIFHTQLCHSPSFTHIFVNHHLSHTIFHNLVTLRDSGTLRGRHSTWRHLPSFRLAGMLQVALGGALGRRWSPLVAGDAAALWMAGVALGDIYLRFAWHACYRLHLVARLVAVGRRWSPLVAVGRRWSPVTPRHFAWQAWNLATSIFLSRGRRGTWRHLCPFHVAGVALGDIYLRFAWQACYRLHLWHAILHTTLSHTIFHTPLCLTSLCLTPSFTTPSCTHHFVTHHLSPHHLSHTIFHTPSFGTPSFTHHFVTHHLWHTTFHPASLTHHLSHTTLSCALFHTLSHTIFHTQLCHTHTLSPSFFVTDHLSYTTLPHTTLSFLLSLPRYNIWHTIFHTPLCHTPSSYHALSFTYTFTHTIFHTELCHTHTHTPSFFVTDHLSYTTLPHTTLSFLLSLPRYNIWCFLLEEVALWGYPVL